MTAGTRALEDLSSWFRATIVALVLWWAPAGAAQPAAPLSDAGPVLEDLSRQAQDGSRPEAERLKIIQTLGEWGTDQVRTPLLAVLTDPSPAIRAASARALGWANNRQAVAALRDRVEAREEVNDVRAAALESLGRIGDDSVRASVVAATRDSDDKVRGAALWSVTLGSLVSQADRPAFLKQVAEDRGVELSIRSQSILALGQLKDTGAIDILIRILEREPPIPMRVPADTATQQEIMFVRYQQRRDVRAWAAIALGLLEGRAALPLLLKTAEDQDDFFLRLSSLQALAIWNPNPPEALPVLLRRLDDPLPEVRAAALHGLEKSGDQSVVPRVVARLSDKASAVQLQAIKTLAELGDSRVRPQLEALQRNDADPRIQEAVEKALARLKP